MIKEIKCSSEQLDMFRKTYNLKLHWFEGGDYYTIYLDDEPAALICINQGTIDGYCEISEFEVFHKNIGIGKKIINHYLSDGNKFHLYAANAGAKAFWDKLGFEVIDDGTGTPMHIKPNL